MTKSRKKPRKKSLLPVEEESIVVVKEDFPIVKPVGPIEGVPLGLELLLETNSIFIKRQETPDEIDDFVPMKGVIPYDIIDCNKGKIYFAWESDDRGSIKVVDFASRPVMEITNRSGCLNCLLGIFSCLGSTGYSASVTLPDGSKLGKITQKYNGLTPKFLLENDFEKHFLTLTGPVGGYCCCNFNMESSWLVSTEFPLTSLTEEKVGSILRGSPDPIDGLETFGLNFSKELGVKEKAVILGSVFVMNYLFFKFHRSPFDPDVVEMYAHEQEKERRHTRAETHKRDMNSLGLTEDGVPIMQLEQPVVEDKARRHSEGKTRRHSEQQRKSLKQAGV